MAEQKITIREEVEWFAQEMEKILQANDHKPGWEGDELGCLYSRLREEAEELRRVLLRDDVSGLTAAALSTDVLRLIIKEAVDVANFAMMISDNCRRWL